jgi:riboflavin kinase/FMN adenylyltransferase
MQIGQGLDALRHLKAGSVLSVGNFDGLHRGHQRILEMARNLRDQHPGSQVCVVTFEPHPLTVLRPQAVPPKLLPLALKESQLGEMGVDCLVILPPERPVLNLEAEDFWRLLRDEAKVRHMVEGKSFNFGKNRGGTIERLRQWTQGSPVTLHVTPTLSLPLLDCQLAPVSSSVIRWLLNEGRARDAAICLGRPYMIEGEVVQGHQRGRGIGMPTANLQVTEQLIPADGVYAGRCRHNGQIYSAALSIGTMPTFGPNARQVEAHLIGFDGDLYGQRLQVELLDWLRPQLRYNDVEQLKAQLQRDVVATSARRNLDPARPIVHASDN